MVDKNIIQSRFTKLGVVPIDNQHYLYATLDNNLIGIIVFIKTCDNHYFDEEDIDIGKPLQCDVRIDHVVELTEEEKAQARQAAMQRAEREAYANLMQPKKKKPATQPEPAEKIEQASLF